ncbi:metallopeptidase TldD-related protein, partial [Sphingomonas bacterium]|uniref:metallopeptidase TldD-related protein n=1 Tax=Sphingomonas bacterium TaxID=1895847 RepID=UPI0015762305
MNAPLDARSFLYRDQLSPEAAQALTAQVLAKADDGELYLQYRKAEAFGFDDGRLKTASYDTAAGFGLRAVSGEMTAFAHANELSEAAIRRAGETMALIDPAAGPRAAPPRATNRHLYTDADPLDLVPFADKVNLCQRIDAEARARDPRVAQVSVGLSGTWSVVEVVRADGFVATDVRPLVRLNVSIVVEQNGRRETGTYGTGGRYLYDRLFEEATWRRGIDEALRHALVNLDSVAAPAGEMTVLLGAGWPGIVLHEAIGHGLEGDFNRKGTSAFSGRIGERVAAPGVTVVDDGSIPDRRGSLTIDDEGTPTGETVLIEDGILKGYMQDRLNARLMGVAATGNGRRESFAHAPMPRMTNTFMKGGQDDPAELMTRVKRGIFAKSFGGGQV